MKKKGIITIIFVITLTLSVFLYFHSLSNKGISTSINISEVMSADDTLFKKVIAQREFEFPVDYLAHNDYKIEWWYFTGNLQTKEGEKFGYQFTIFRTGLNPENNNSNNSFSTKNVYLCHFAISDINNQEFYSTEKFSRENLALAGATLNPYKVWVENWMILGEFNEDTLKPNFSIKAEAKDFGIDINLKPAKKMVLHGDNGFSKKSNSIGSASYYYSFTRLNTEGMIKIKNKEFKVNGLSWMDREWSTSALNSEQAGWDWFSIQLENGYDLMFFKLRNKNGKTNFAIGTMIDPQGNKINLAQNTVELIEDSIWESSDGTKYPGKWILKIPSQSIDLRILTQIPNQEHHLSTRYYEGSISLTGTFNGQSTSGQGYIEMTGY